MNSPLVLSGLRKPAILLLAALVACGGGGGGGGSSSTTTATSVSAMPEFTRGFAQFAGTPSAAAAGDIDGDGRDDFVVATTGSDQLYVFYQRANGPESASAPTASAGTRSVAVCDVDGDGKSEILVGYAAGDLTIYKPGSDGRPALWQTMAGVAAATVQCADIDGDGQADVITTGKPGFAMQVLLQRNGALVETGSYPGNPVTALDVGDVDGDGKAEVVVSGSTIPMVYQQGTWVPLAYAGVPADVKGLAVAQLAPGKRNVVFTTTSQVVITTQGAAPLSLPTAPNAGYVRVRDLNADGRADIVVFHGGAVGVYYQNADGTFSGEQALATYPADPSSGAPPVAFGDFDGDGRLDVVAASATAATLFFQDVMP